MYVHTFMKITIRHTKTFEIIENPNSLEFDIKLKSSEFHRFGPNPKYIVFKCNHRHTNHMAVSENYADYQLACNFVSY